MPTQIPHDSESDGLDFESGESLHCPWLTRPAHIYNAMQRILLLILLLWHSYNAYNLGP